MAASLPHPERIATLDLLRVVAALAVLAFHYVFRGSKGTVTAAHAAELGPSLAIYGYLGVNLFFLISGFVIAWSAQGRSWFDFAIARATRIYPGFLVCMAATFGVLFLAADPRFEATWNQFAANFLILSPALGQAFMDGVYWSIVLEIVFYGWIAVALMTNVFDRWRLELIAGWLAVCVVNQFWLHDGLLRYVAITEFGGLFCAGMLFQHIDQHGRSLESLGLVLAAFLASSASMLDMHLWMQAHYGHAVPMPNLAIANLALFAMVAAAIRWRHVIPATATILALGGMTYPLYLLHQNIGYLAIESLSPHLGKFAAIVSTTLFLIAAALLVWRFIEPVGQKRLRRVLIGLRDRLGAAFASAGNQNTETKKGDPEAAL